MYLRTFIFSYYTNFPTPNLHPIFHALSIFRGMDPPTVTLKPAQVSLDLEIILFAKSQNTPIRNQGDNPDLTKPYVCFASYPWVVPQWNLKWQPLQIQILQIKFVFIVYIFKLLSCIKSYMLNLIFKIHVVISIGWIFFKLFQNIVQLIN